MNNPWIRFAISFKISSGSAAERKALAASPRQPCHHALADHRLLELREHAKHLKQRLVCGCRGIDALLVQVEIDTLGVDFGQHAEQVL
jgi:hypothetical protein